jgi:hypothetical protein
MEEATIEKLVELVLTLSQENRLEFVQKLGSEMCFECGREDPRCRCWDDS